MPVPTSSSAQAGANPAQTAPPVRPMRAGHGPPPPSRLPGATSSLRVQLPLTELADAYAAHGGVLPTRLGNNAVNTRPNVRSAGVGALVSARQAGPSRSGPSPSARATGAPASGSTAEASTSGAGMRSLPRIEASDEDLLRASVLGQQARARTVLQWQERLMDDKGVSRQELKRATTHLSVSSWLQVLHERHLTNVCAYPTCSNPPSKPEISQRGSALPASAPRYRISRRAGGERAIVPDKRDEPGGRNGFCSDACWRRAEWVRRWVLAGSGREGKPDKDGEGESEGGRWERLVDEGAWRDVELLEDLEERGEVPGLEQQKQPLERADDAALSSPRQSPPAQRAQAQPLNVQPTLPQPQPQPQAMSAAEAQARVYQRQIAERMKAAGVSSALQLGSSETSTTRPTPNSAPSQTAEPAAHAPTSSSISTTTSGSPTVADTNASSKTTSPSAADSSSPVARPDANSSPSPAARHAPTPTQITTTTTTSTAPRQVVPPQKNASSSAAVAALLDSLVIHERSTPSTPPRGPMLKDPAVASSSSSPASAAADVAPSARVKPGQGLEGSTGPSTTSAPEPSLSRTSTSTTALGRPARRQAGRGRGRGKGRLARAEAGAGADDLDEFLGFEFGAGQLARGIVSASRRSDGGIPGPGPASFFGKSNGGASANGNGTGDADGVEKSEGEKDGREQQEGEEEPESDEETRKDREELADLMELAMDVRDEQRALGLLA